VGSAALVAYDPVGEYVLTSNAPIGRHVGLPPGTTKLWYANPFTDERAASPYDGALLGSRIVSVMKVASGGEGSRVATFSSDGRARIYDIFPASAVSVISKGEDFFGILGYTNGTPPSFGRLLQPAATY
jgi:hypothetical protein